MPVLLLNITGNKKDFENEMCDNIHSHSQSDVTLLSKRGLDLFEGDSIIDGYSLVVVLAHGENENQDSCSLDTGLDLNAEIPTPIKTMLNSPTILTQILGNNSQKYILFFVACSAFSAELLVSVMDDNNCIGTISSRTAIGSNEYKKIAKIIDNLQTLEDNNKIDKTNVDAVLRNARMPNLVYDENSFKIISS